MTEIEQINNLLISGKFKCTVTSTLNKDTKQHGKIFMFDKEEDTSWSSDQGTPQKINICFSEPQKLQSFNFQFQGGFAGNESTVYVEDSNKKVLYEEPFYPEDINSIQNFKFNQLIEQALKIKFTFNSSTDFFGRIIVYKLQIF